jgi:hypothetical protein
MKLLDRLRNRSPRGEAGGPGSAEAGSADEQRLPIARFDQLDRKRSSPGSPTSRRSSWPPSRPTSARTETGPWCSTGCAG